MKRILPFLLCAALLWGCAPAEAPTDGTTITLSDGGITAPAGVEVGGQIVYYEDRLTYDSSNPYGEGTQADRHTAEEAAAHTKITIKEPGSYTVTGSLSAGQICVDLGEDAREDPNAVVELILKDAEISCTIAPAILFLNVYECDPDRTEENATPNVDTSKAGANLVLEGENTVNGAYVARIYKDKEGEKKLWKQDGAIYSYMSMNVGGSGSLTLTAENEGLDTERHLTIGGGDITIYAQNDGINTNEDGVSVTTINGGSVNILAGLEEEGDGIDSNGYLVINGGTVIASAHPASDAGLDSDLGSYINGGFVVALGAPMDWAETESGQVTMNLQFAQRQSGRETLEVRKEDGTVLLACTPFDEVAVSADIRQYQGAILSCPEFKKGETYEVYVGDAQMAYAGTDVGGHRPGGPGGPQMPEGEPPAMPEGNFTPPGRPEGNSQPPEGDFPGEPPEKGDFPAEPPEDTQPQPGGRHPQPGDPGTMGDLPEDAPQWGDLPGATDSTIPQRANTAFLMSDLVNFFSGLTPAE